MPFKGVWKGGECPVQLGVIIRARWSRWLRASAMARSLSKMQKWSSRPRWQIEMAVDTTEFAMGITSGPDSLCLPLPIRLSRPRHGCPPLAAEVELSGIATR